MLKAKTVKAELERELRSKTDTERYSGDFEPRAPRNLVFNIAWQLYHGMENPDRRIQINPGDSPCYAYFRESMRRVGLINASDILTEMGVEFHRRFKTEKFYISAPCD